MSSGESGPRLDLEALLKEISAISDVNQFTSGVSNRPQIMFDAFQHFSQSHEALKNKSNELDAALRHIQKLESTPSNMIKEDPTNIILGRLADVLTRESSSKLGQ